MAVGKPWVFQNQKRSVTLDGWSAPFGRPRHGEIINAGQKVRETITYYPGSSAPTVHTFGLEPKPFQLHGRWMDFAIGSLGGARALARSMKSLQSDQLEVQASWGDVLAYTIFIHDLNLKYESEAEIDWSLEAHVLIDEQAPVISAPAPVQSPSDLANQLNAALSGANLVSLPTAIRALQGQIANDLTTLLDNVTAPIATLTDTCFAIQDFTTASLTDVGQILASCSLIEASYLSVRDSTDLMVSQIGNQSVATIVEPSGLYTGQDAILAATSKADSDADIANILLLVQALQDQATAGLSGRASTAYTVRLGDSWESIATLTLGSPSGANAIRDLNGVQYGQRPIPGSVIKVPAQG